MGKDRKKKKKKPNKPSEVSQSNVENTSDNGETIETQHLNNGNTDTKDDNYTNNYTVEDLMSKIEQYMDTFNYELAQKFCERALELDGNHLELLEMAGAVFLETGETEKAEKCFQHAIQLCPDHGHAKYMYIGQILQGQEAVQAFTKGIELMVAALDASSKGASASADHAEVVTSADISTAYCSLAEIYMTDECFDSDAETKCHNCCTKAIEYDACNPDAYQTMANCLLSQEKTQDANDVLKQGLDLWLGKDDDEDNDDTKQVPMPSYESRLTSTKLLLELGDYELGASVLQTLLEENDEDPQVWYLLGWMYHLSGQDNANKQTCLENAKKFYKLTDSSNKDVLQHIEELLASSTQIDSNGEDEAMETA